MYKKVTNDLRAAYDRAADDRDKRELAPWKERERQAYLELLQQEDKHTLLEIGAGSGRDSLFFQQNGLWVISSDLSPEMVRLCRQKGLEAYEMDFLNLDFADASFEAVYALSCLLHVPKAHLAEALLEIRRVMAPGGLFFFGVYGGIEKDGPWEDDVHVPKRHFALYLDEQIKAITGDFFAVCDFRAIKTPDSRRSGIHYQRLILQKGKD